MKQARQIFIKDLRRLQWILLAWFALICARTFVETVGADIALGGFGPQIGIREVSSLLSVMYTLFLPFLVSRLVHEEPLVGRDAFWITRPIAPGALMGAKLAFAALFFIAVPVAADIVVAAAFGTRDGALAATIPVAALNQLLVVALLMALAAVTPSLTRFVLAILGIVATLATLLVSATLVMLFVSKEFTEEEVHLPDPTPAVVGGVLVVLVALAVMIYQYRTRRLGRALTIGGIGACLVFVAPERWPWSFAVRPHADVAAPPQDTTAVAVSLDGSAPRINDAEVSMRRRGPAKALVTARARVAGVPPEFILRTIVARSRLELAGGAVLESSRNSSGAAAHRVVSGSTSERGSAVEAALGGVRLLTKGGEIDEMSTEWWPTLLRVDERDFVQHRREPGRLTANLDLVFERPVVRGALPLADGSTRDIGPSKFSIVRVIRHPTGCTVLFRRSYVETLFTSPRYSDPFMYVLRNGGRGEAAHGDARPLSSAGFSAGTFYLSKPGIGGRGFVLEQYEIVFNARARSDGSPVDLDEAWIDGAELVILESIPAGVISRTMTIDRFQMVP
jgi:hypothetical protein